jgi:hypothetical protein
MYLNNYKKTVIKNLNLHQGRVYNINTLSKDCAIRISTSFSTFKSDKNLKFTKLYYLLFMVGSQKPILKKVKFAYLNKKILKRFNIVATLSKSNGDNFLFYLSSFYLYFYHIYYEKSLKYNVLGSCYSLYLDNIQFFVKSYYKQAQKTQIKVSLFSQNSGYSNNSLRQLTGGFFLKVKKI